jgi:hypothetical protein
LANLHLKGLLIGTKFQRHAGRLRLLDSEQLLLRRRHLQAWRAASDALLPREVQCTTVLHHGPVQRLVASRQVGAIDLV